MISICCQFVLNRVGGCEVYGGVCCGWLPVYVYFYVSDVEKIDVDF